MPEKMIFESERERINVIVVVLSQTFPLCRTCQFYQVKCQHAHVRTNLIQCCSLACRTWIPIKTFQRSSRTHMAMRAWCYRTTIKCIVIATQTKTKTCRCTIALHRTWFRSAMMAISILRISLKLKWWWRLLRSLETQNTFAIPISSPSYERIKLCKWNKFVPLHILLLRCRSFFWFQVISTDDRECEQ